MILAGRPLSEKACAVLAEGQKLWQVYFAYTNRRSLREELKLGRPDVGWYQVRKALQSHNAGSEVPLINFAPFEAAYKELTEKGKPIVYELGFLKT